ncbi:MAG: butyryl-CoA:acetate CoA-transferase, partial [Syntrophomonadaceae bacterium]|nr:butyryl-CoA:acetate CoA-transferase [Syntrophomonadaceae bacterium]
MSKDIAAMYKSKLCSAEEAVRGIEDGSWIDYGFFNGKPILCDKALAARKDELKEIFILAAVTLPPLPEVLNSDPKGEVFTYNSFHFSPVDRIMQQHLPNVFYNPILYS